MIIALTGKMGSGKSTATQILAKLNRDSTATVKFAQPLYDIQEMIYNRISDVYQRPHTFIKDRKLLQWIGTEWGRGTISDSIWVDLWSEDVRMILNMGTSLVLCDDVRFDNEARMVRAMGGSVVEIISDLTEKRIDTKAGISNHSSEAGVSADLVDYQVKNNGSLAEFENSLAHMMNVIKLKQEL
jgi:ABC-type oligopeptide transport system ATPase subunit